MTTADLETRTRSFEEEVAEAIQREFGDGPHWFYRNGIPLDVILRDASKRRDVLDYLDRNKGLYGRVRLYEKAPLAMRDNEPEIGLILTREQARNLAQAIDSAYDNRGPEFLKYVGELRVGSSEIARLQ